MSSQTTIADSWHRFQHVSMRTKIVVPMVLLAVGPALVVAALTVSGMRRALRERAFERIEFGTITKAGELQGFLAGLQEDLVYLSYLDSIRQLAQQPSGGGGEELAVDAERELMLFARAKRAYCGVRCLNLSGHELVRLEVRDGEAFAARDLSSTDGEVSGPLEPNQIRVSTRQRTGGVEPAASPYHRGIVQYATAVPGDGNSPGRLVIDVCIGHTLMMLGELEPKTEAWLVDEGGSYLGYLGEEPAKMDAYDLERRRPLAADYSPGQVRKILGADLGSRTFVLGDRLVSSAPIAFDGGRPEAHWTLLMTNPLEPIEAPVRSLTLVLALLGVAVAAMAGLTGLWVSHYLARPVARLREATREIAAGDLSKRVSIRTGDELEGLAADFNTMTYQLSEAQESLARWNESLEREVARQTQRLRQLQSGLARTDKLATIGQMTAGVLHEVGNPLAALKTKIQVAQESGESAGSELLPELLTEVDRLAAFLRSFSRISKMPEPSMARVSLPEVLHGVVTLVTPQLKRSLTPLTVRLGDDVPAVDADADQLRQLLINLILNAAEASAPGQEISLRAERGSSPEGAPTARIEVVDHGIGMSRETRAKMWDLFFSTKDEGTGLGLAICRRIVSDHSGQIEVESGEDRGTTIILTFPGARNAGGSPKGEPS